MRITTLLAAVTLVALATPASSADWTSVYLGTEISGGQVYIHSVRNSGSSLFPVGFTERTDESGTPVGFTAGADSQFKWLVVGIIGSWQEANMNGVTRIDSPLVKGYYVIQPRDTDWLGDISGRIGFAWDRLLFYGKGGAGWRRFDESAFDDTYNKNNVLISAAQSLPNTQFGYVVGGGIEWQPARTISIKVEFDWYNFGAQPSEPTTCISGSKCTTGAAGIATTYPTVGEVKVGMNIHLDWPTQLALLRIK